MKYLLTVIALCVTATAHAACVPMHHAPIPAITGQVWDDARPALLASGWAPARTMTDAQEKTDPDFGFGNAQVFWHEGYKGLQACAGTGVAPCHFRLRDSHGNELQVTTAGEERTAPGWNLRAKVTGFSFVVCGK